MKKLVLFNVFFSPSSFGGATIVCEETAKILSDMGWDILVVTTNNFCHPYTKIRYQIDNIDIISVGIPHDLTFEKLYHNPEFADVVRGILSIFQPDVAHIHCIQKMGADLVDELYNQNIPTVLTIHDCWWFCERQFMINNHSIHCANYNNNESCIYCVDDCLKTGKRLSYLQDRCSKVSRLLYPSNFHNKLHINWGFPVEKSFTNKNGIRWPHKDFKRDRSNLIRFGFVGGPGPIKGADLIHSAFKSVKRKDYELIVVDAAKNLGLEWAEFKNWSIPGKLTIHPPYLMENMDEFYKKIDVLLFPSLWKESFGLTVREALSRDIWVISTDAGGAVEDIVDGENGVIIPLTNNPKHLIEEINQILQSPKRIKNNINRHKDLLRSYEKQAQEINVHLQEVMRG